MSSKLNFSNANIITNILDLDIENQIGYVEGDLAFEINLQLEQLQKYFPESKVNLLILMSLNKLINIKRERQRERDE